MGCYINTVNMTKDFWLYNQQEGTLEAPVWDDMPEGMLPVCLVQNEMFSAAGVAFNEEERDDFARDDGRPKRWFVLPIESIRAVSDLDKWLKAA